MKKEYIMPSACVANALLNHNITVDSIKGDDAGYGGGADPSTGRAKDRDDDDFDEMAEGEMAENEGLW